MEATPRVLVVDVGGTNVKIAVGGTTEVVKIPSGPEMTAAQMVSAVRVAVDQELSDLEAPLSGAREVAFFPPMTGG